MSPDTPTVGNFSIDINKSTAKYFSKSHSTDLNNDRPEISRTDYKFVIRGLVFDMHSGARGYTVAVMYDPPIKTDTGFGSSGVAQLFQSFDKMVAMRNGEKVEDRDTRIELAGILKTYFRLNSDHVLDVLKEI